MTNSRGMRMLLAAALVALATPGVAVDGVIEINQAQADKGGVTAGDAPGFPITISTGTFANEPMSFRLTGPLFTSTSSNVIEVQSGHVSIDLNGFAITCLLPLCNGSGISSNAINVAVSNGTVRGCAQGLALGGLSARVENVRAVNNTAGLVIGGDCVIRGNTVTYSGGRGIDVGLGCDVTGNIASGNGEDGIRTSSSALVADNVVRDNTGRGLTLSPGTAYRGNVIGNNDAGTVQGGVNAGANVCNTSTTCP